MIYKHLTMLKKVKKEGDLPPEPHQNALGPSLTHTTSFT